jgi:hypothetical protein
MGRPPVSGWGQTAGEYSAVYQDTTSEAAEKLPRSLKKRQGTTSVVPQMQQNKFRALAPEGCFHPDLPESASFSATSEVVP